MDNISKFYYNKAVSLQEQYNFLNNIVCLLETSEADKILDIMRDGVRFEDLTKEQQKILRRATKELQAKEAARKAARKMSSEEKKRRGRGGVPTPSSTTTPDKTPPPTTTPDKTPPSTTPPAKTPAPTTPAASISKPSVVQRGARYAKEIGKLLPSFAGYIGGNVAGQYLSNFAGIENELGREAVSTTTGGIGLAAGESAIPAAQAARQAGLKAGSSSLLRGTAAATAPAIGMLGGYAVGSKAAEKILDYAGIENETGRFAATQAGGLIGTVPGAALAAGTVGGGKALLAGAGLKGAALAGKAAAVAGAGAALSTTAAGAGAVGGYMLGDYIGDKTGLHKYIGDKLGGADKLTEKPTGTVGGVEAINLKNKEEEAEEEQRRQEMDRKYIAKPKEELVKEILAKRKAAREAQTQN